MRKWLGGFRRAAGDESAVTATSSKYVQNFDASSDSSGVSFKDDLLASLTPAAQRVVSNWGLTDQELVTLYRLYARCDQNNDGVVDLQEFYSILHIKRITRFHDKLLHLISAHVRNNGVLGLGSPNVGGAKRNATMANNRDSVVTVAGASQISKSNGGKQPLQQPFGQNGVFTAAANRFSVFKSTGRAKIMTNTGTAPSAVRENPAVALVQNTNADKALKNASIVPLQPKPNRGGRSHAIRDSVFDGSAETTNALLATITDEQAEKAKQLSKPVGSFFAVEAVFPKSDAEPQSPASENLLSSPTADKKGSKATRPSLSAAKGSAGKAKRTKTNVNRSNTRISKTNTFSGRVVIGDDSVELSFSEWLVVVFGFCFATPDELISLVFWRYDAKAQGSWSHSDMCRFLKHMQQDNPLMPFDTVRLLLSLVAYGEKLSYMQFRELCRDLPSLIYPIIHTREQFIHAIFGEKWYIELDHRTDDVYNRISSGQHSARWYISEMLFNLHYYLVAMLILMTCGVGARWYAKRRKLAIEDAQSHRRKMEVLRKVAHMRRTGQLSQAQQLAMTAARQDGRHRKSSISTLMDSALSIKAAGGKNASTDQQIQTLAQQMNVDEQVAQYIVMYKNAEAAAPVRKQSTTRTKGRTNSLMAGLGSSVTTKQLQRKNSVSEFVSSFAGVTDEFLGIRDAADIAPYINLPPEAMLSLYDSDGDDTELNRMIDCQYDELVHNEGSEDSSDEEA